jgi:hypothetical protein
LHELEGIGTYADFSPERLIHRYNHENHLSYKEGHKAGQEQVHAQPLDVEQTSQHCIDHRTDGDEKPQHIGQPRRYALQPLVTIIVELVELPEGLGFSSKAVTRTVPPWGTTPRFWAGQASSITYRV